MKKKTLSIILATLLFSSMAAVPVSAGSEKEPQKTSYSEEYCVSGAVQDYKQNTSMTLTPNSATEYEVRASVRNSEGSTADNDFALKGNVRPLQNESTVSKYAWCNNDVTVNCYASNGLGEKQFAVLYKEPGSTSWKTASAYSTKRSVTFVPTKSGDYTVRVKAKDEKGTVKVKDITLSVKNYSFSLNKTVIQRGDTAVITADSEPGNITLIHSVLYQEPGQTSWKTLCGDTPNNRFTFSPVILGDYTIRVKTKNTNGKVTSQDLKLTVKEGALKNISSLASPTILCGRNAAVNCASLKGKSAVKYTVLLKAPCQKDFNVISPYSSKDLVYFNADMAGQYTVRVKAKDAEGTVSVKDLKLTAYSTPNNYDILYHLGVVGTFTDSEYNRWNSDYYMQYNNLEGVYECIIHIDEVKEDMISPAYKDDGTDGREERGFSGVQSKIRKDGKWDYSWGEYEDAYERTENSQTDFCVKAVEGQPLNFRVFIDPNQVVCNEITPDDYDAYYVWRTGVETVLENKSTLSSNTIHLGSTVTVNCKAAGAKEYMVVYTEPGSVVPQQLAPYSSESKLTFKPEKQGSYTLWVYARNASGSIGLNEMHLYVKVPLVNNSSISRTKCVQGDTVSINCRTYNTIGDEQFMILYQEPGSTNWKTLSPFSDQKDAEFTPSKAGTYTIRVKAKDSISNPVSKDFTITVEKPRLTCTSGIYSGQSVEIGKPLTLYLSSEYGTGEKKYTVLYQEPESTNWKTAMPYSAAETFDFVPKVSGKYNIRIRVKDEAGKTAYSDWYLVVPEQVENTSALASDTIKLGETAKIQLSSSGQAVHYAVYYKKVSSEKWTQITVQDLSDTAEFKPAAAVVYDVRVDAIGNQNGATDSKIFKLTVKK